MTQPSLLLLSDFYVPHWTGITKGMRELMRALSSRFRCTVLTVRHNDEIAPDEVLDGVRVLRAEPSFQLSRGFVSLKLLIELFRQVPRHDVLLVNSPSMMVLPAAILCKLFGRKLVVFHQGDLILRSGAINWVIEKAFDACTKLACLLADNVCTYTEDYARNSRILSPFLKKFKVLLLPIPVADAAAEVSPALNPLIEQKKAGNFVFGLAGRFVWEKGYDILFRAIPDILKSCPQVVFAFAGPTEMPYEDFFSETRADFEKVKDRVLLLGLLPDEQLAHFYKLIDFVVICSRSDCFNLVQAEACLLGVPSVVSDIPGARWLVSHTGFGVVAGKEDPKKLAEALVEVSKRKTEIMSYHGKVVEVLNREKIVADAEAFFLRLTSASSHQKW